MPEIFADEGQLLYLPHNEEPSKPYWKAFMLMAVTTKTMEVSEENIEMVAFIDENEKLIGIQTPEPIDDTGAPIERVVNFLEAFLYPEDVEDFVSHVLEVKKQLFDFNGISEFMEIVKNLGRQMATEPSPGLVLKGCLA